MSDQQRKSLKPVPAARGVLFLFFIVARPFPHLLGSLLLLLSGLIARPIEAAAPAEAVQRAGGLVPAGGAAPGSRAPAGICMLR